MTDQSTPDHRDAADQVLAFRDAFGADLVGAARRRERRAPRRRKLAGFATATAAAIFVLTAVLMPGERSAPLLGASPAEAAVQELARSLGDGVLVRVAENTQYVGVKETVQETDWTDLASRDRRTRITGPRPEVQFWNTSAHERWTVDDAFSAPDGRRIVEHHVDRGSQNNSATASPVEEIEELRDLAARGELALRRERGADGTEEIVLERREHCYATPDLSSTECPTTDEAWPGAVPAGMKAVTSFQTWTLAGGDEPRMLRLENGEILAGTTERRVAFRSVYSRWDVLPSTDANLALVQPPAFPEDRYLEVDGPEAVGDGVRAGTILCRGTVCPT